MIELSDYKEPFDAVIDFEQELASYTGAPYVVTTDCCTHALELCLRYLTPSNTITIPNRTYLSVPMVLHILNLDYKLREYDWKGCYQLEGTPVWDNARMLVPDMYQTGQFQCLSFGRTKPLEIGRGGAILTDDKEAYNWLKLASYDGRNLSINPWQDQETFRVGYHYMMRPEECVTGINAIKDGDIKHEYHHTYPDISKVKIID